MDGKGPKQIPEGSSAAVPARSAPSDSNKRASQQPAAPSGASTSTRQKSGKLVFGSSASNKKEAQAQKVVFYCDNTLPVFPIVHIPLFCTEFVSWQVKPFKFSVFGDKFWTLDMIFRFIYMQEINSFKGS